MDMGTPALWQQIPDEELPRSQLQVQLLHKKELTGTVKKNNEDRVCRTSRIGQHHGVVNHGPCAQMGKTIELIEETVAEKKQMDGT